MFIHKNIIFVQNVTLSQNIVKNSGIIIVQKAKTASLSKKNCGWLAEREGSLLIFAHRLGLFLLKRFAKIFGHRSQTTHRVVWITAFESLLYSRKSKKAPSLRMLPAFGGERGIRTLVCLRTN